MDLKQIVIFPSNTTFLFHSGMTTCFVLRRESSRHHYKNFKIRYNAVQNCACFMVRHMTYKVYIQLFKHRLTGNALAGDCVRVVHKNV